MLMRRIGTTLLLFIVLVSSVHAESVFLPAYRRASVQTYAGFGAAVGGFVLALAGLSVSTIESADPTATEVNFAPILWTALGGGLVGGGIGVGLAGRHDMERLELAMDIESRLSSREKRLILDEEIAPGIPEPVLRASLGDPAQINQSHPGPDQYVYSTLYVYVENGRVTGWN